MLLITYDLNRPGKDYPSLYSAIKSISRRWWHHLTSVWIIETNLTPQQVAQKLITLIDKNDELLVVKLQSDYDGQLPQDAWNWLKDRIF